MPQRNRLFHFSYFEPYKDQDKAFRRIPIEEITFPRIHEIRDGDAFVELSEALSQKYEYHGLILNYPDPDAEVRKSEFAPTDLLVLTTRPPLDDDSEVDRKAINRSFTELEINILDETLRNYFDCCSRAQVIINENFADFMTLPDRSEVEFHVFQDTEHGGHKSRYKRYRDVHACKGTEAHRWHDPKEQNLTAAYMILTRIKDGPMLLNAFGMGGQTTLIWCYLLRTKFAHLLKSPRFVIAEIETDPRPLRPATLSFALKWKVTLLLNHPLS
jgi:hypothetical protein